ncbi:hypothetical protein AMTR_s00012p00247830 [Amborella trichopoda]|uniref:Uncharacterized protein n=1 Tax=Amborella trichopoda TaxID=13333 RepID=W1PJV6_AMBTC|nr:hypothetical protein AMTR_s00012p00247830 [Amborella trichopoda]
MGCRSMIPTTHEILGSYRNGNGLSGTAWLDLSMGHKMWPKGWATTALRFKQDWGLLQDHDKAGRPGRVRPNPPSLDIFVFFDCLWPGPARPGPNRARARAGHEPRPPWPGQGRARVGRGLAQPRPRAHRSFCHQIWIRSVAKL